jgi:hypothetical protein
VGTGLEKLKLKLTIVVVWERENSERDEQERRL